MAEFGVLRYDMSVTCTPTALANASRCYIDMPWSMRQAIRIINWCAYLNGTTMTCTPAALAAAARAFVGSLSAAQLDAIETYLSCQIANAGGGGGDQEVFVESFGGVAPVSTPTASSAIAIDKDSPFNIWKWDGISWT